MQQETNQLLSTNNDSITASTANVQSNASANHMLESNHQLNITTMDVNELEVETTTSATASSTAATAPTETTTEVKLIKNDSIVRSDIDSKKIQSDTKDIEIESSDNILQLKRIVPAQTTTTQATLRSTQPNVFSNAGGNGGTLDDVQTLTVDSVVRRRHSNRRRRRQGRCVCYTVLCGLFHAPTTKHPVINKFIRIVFWLKFLDIENASITLTKRVWNAWRRSWPALRWRK